MKKFTILILLAIFGLSGFAQCTYTFSPSGNTYGTGRADLYNKLDGEIKAGTATANNFKGWVNFWVGLAQESGSTLDIDLVEIRTYTNTVSSSSNHMLDYEEMTVDPFTASRSAIRSDIGSNTEYSWGSAGQNLGWSSWENLTTAAEADLQTILNSGPGYFPIGFEEYNMDDDRCIIDGRNDANPPELRVTYSRIPDNPPNPTSNSPQCSNITLYRSGSVPSGQTWYWQSSSSGTNTSLGSGSTYTVYSSGTYYIRARHNACGNWSSSLGSVTVSLLNTPSQPGTITGNTTVCSGVNQPYSISSVSGATSYTWSYTGGGSPSGTGTSCNLSPTSSGTLSVTANNTCGSSSPRTKSITVISTPNQPGSISGNTTVCSGNNETYSISSVSGATSYTWSYSGGGTPSGTGTSCNLSPTSSGTLSVTANNTCGSSSQRTKSITVISTPNQPGSISGNTTVCSGNNETYSISSVSGATSYTWSYSGGGTPSGTGTSCNLSPTSSGTLSVTANNTCGSSSQRTQSITVISTPNQPGSISGNTTVCSGNNETYSISSVSGATSYTWSYSGGGTPSGTGTSCNLSPTSSGTLSVTANNTCGSSSQRTQSITVINTPNQPGSINGNTTVCSGNNETYSISSVSGATSYTWTYSGGGTPSGTGTSCNLSPTSSGTLSVTANNTCGSSSQRTQSITVNDVPPLMGPISGDDTPCFNQQYSYDISPASGATSYTWSYSGGGTPSGTSTSCTLTPTSAGTLSVAANNTCGSSTTITQYLAAYNCTGIEETSVINSLSIYPNPTSGILYLKTDFDVSKIEISNLLGKQILLVVNKKQIDLSELPTGMYMIKVYDKENKVIAIEKIIKN